MLDEHVKIHGRFRQKVEELRVRLHEGKNSTAASILSFLGDWLAEHILGVDAQYRDFLASKGVQ
jgi:hemerythrin-like metal-binding protein